MICLHKTGKFPSKQLKDLWFGAEGAPKNGHKLTNIDIGSKAQIVSLLLRAWKKTRYCLRTEKEGLKICGQG